MYTISNFGLEPENLIFPMHKFNIRTCRSTCYKTLLKAGLSFQKDLKKDLALIDQNTKKNPLESGKAISTVLVMTTLR